MTPLQQARLSNLARRDLAILRRCKAGERLTDIARDLGMRPRTVGAARDRARMRLKESH